MIFAHRETDTGSTQAKRYARDRGLPPAHLAPVTPGGFSVCDYCAFRGLSLPPRLREPTLHPQTTGKAKKARESHCIAHILAAYTPTHVEKQPRRRGV
jgi:hypothetical protein